MLVSDIITSARYRLNDAGSVEYSDAELLDYVNTVQRFINKFLIAHDSGLVKATTTLDTSSGSHALPSDFMAIWYVKDDNDVLVRHKDPIDSPVLNMFYPTYSVTNPSYYYYVVGNDIYSNLDSIELGYYKKLDDNAATTDTVPLPDSFRNVLLEMVLIIAFNRNEFAINIEELLTRQFSEALNSLISNYGFAYRENIMRKMPWMV